MFKRLFIPVLCILCNVLYATDNNLGSLFNSNVSNNKLFQNKELSTEKESTNNISLNENNTTNNNANAAEHFIFSSFSQAYNYFENGCNENMLLQDEESEQAIATIQQNNAEEDTFISVEDTEHIENGSLLNKKRKHPINKNINKYYEYEIKLINPNDFDNIIELDENLENIKNQFLHNSRKFYSRKFLYTPLINIKKKLKSGINLQDIKEKLLLRKNNISRNSSLQEINNKIIEKGYITNHRNKRIKIDENMEKQYNNMQIDSKNKNKTNTNIEKQFDSININDNIIPRIQNELDNKKFKTWTGYLFDLSQKHNKC